MQSRRHGFAKRTTRISQFLTLWFKCQTAYGNKLAIDADISQSRQKRQKRNLWQRRFWEHWVRDEIDFAKHCDYIHYNPVKHGLCFVPQEWQFSSLHRLMAQGIYPPNWGVSGIPDMPREIWDE